MRTVGEMKSEEREKCKHGSDKNYIKNMRGLLASGRFLIVSRRFPGIVIDDPTQKSSTRIAARNTSQNPSLKIYDVSSTFALSSSKSFFSVHSVSDLQVSEIKFNFR